MRTPDASEMNARLAPPLPAPVPNGVADKQLPPARGFWSLTLYNEHHFFHPMASVDTHWARKTIPCNTIPTDH